MGHQGIWNTIFSSCAYHTVNPTDKSTSFSGIVEISWSTRLLTDIIQATLYSSHMLSSNF